MFDATASLANAAWFATCLPARRRLMAALDDPAPAQRTVLRRLLAANAETQFGRSHDFSRLQSPGDFQQAVPIRNYDEFAPWIERAKSGEREVLAAGPVLAFERSSGSTAAAKYIPFNAALRSEFDGAVRAWMADLFLQHPSLLGGPAYWLISPLGGPRERTAGGIPVGLDSDAEYLGPFARRLALALFAVPAALAGVDDLETSLDLTIRFLLQTPELRFISVWNASYLSLLWRRFSENAEAFLEPLASGKFGAVPAALRKSLRTMPRRSRALRERWKAHGTLTPQDVWPRLAVVSCWSDAVAATDAAEVGRTFDHCRIQPKGLLATEGVITIPWGRGPGGVPALHSHFFEFEDASGGTRLVHELEPGAEYNVLLSTGGGLWRYRLGDSVRVEGRAGATPRLRFVGRSDGVSDLRGEKLHPRFVGDALNSLGRCFSMLAPAQDGAGYILFTDREATAEKVESALRANPHYAHCRAVGQLAELRVFRIEEDAPAAFLRESYALGQRPGTVKAAALDRRRGWESRFRGRFIEEMA
jgi:hypothetical protein